MQLRPLSVRPGEAALLLGSGEVLADFLKAGWLSPLVSEHRLVLYAFRHLEDCVLRLESGEIPAAPDQSEVRHARMPKSELPEPGGSFDEQSRGVVNVEPLLLRPKAASLYVGTGILLERFRADAWITPLYDRHRLVLYSKRQLAECVGRLEVERLPKRSTKQPSAVPPPKRPYRSSKLSKLFTRKARRTRRQMRTLA